MQKKFVISAGKLIESQEDNAQVLVFINPNEQEKSLLVNQFLIDEHTLNSSLDPEEVARIEFESSHTAVITKRPRRYSHADNYLFKIASAGLFLFQDKLIIILPEEQVLFDGRLFQKVRSVSDIMLKVVFRCIQHFEEHLKVIQKISDELESEINKAMTNKDLVYMFNLEKSLVYYLNAISSNARMIEKMRSSSVRMNLSTEDVELMEDVLIENGQCYQEANTYSQVLSGMMDAWVSVVSNNLNIRIKMLTIISLCIMMPTLIVSIFSMNVRLPVPQTGAIWPFWSILFLALFSGFFIVWLWLSRRW